MQIEFRSNWGSHCGGNGRLLLSSGRRLELRHAGGLAALQNCEWADLDTEEFSQQGLMLNYFLVVFVLFSLLVSEAVIRHGVNIQPAWCDLRWTDQVALTRVSMQTVLVFCFCFFTLRKKYLHKLTGSLKWFRICHAQRYTKFIKSRLSQLTKLRDF